MLEVSVCMCVCVCFVWCGREVWALGLTELCSVGGCQLKVFMNGLAELPVCLSARLSVCPILFF